jgi:DNA-binding LacI/PurR family transcriptional regulator
MYDMGREAGRLLAARIGRDTSLPRTIVLPPDLQVRESSRRG